MVRRCGFVDPKYNFPCGKKSTLAKIVVIKPDDKPPIHKFVCKIHGDPRFEYLSLTENNLVKLKDTNKISYSEFSESMKDVRWKNCRKCNQKFEKTDTIWVLEWYFVTETTVGLRRSFRLHDDCCERELAFYEIMKDNSVKNSTLDKVL